jgi:SAM-dependent methyltransferase
LTRSREEVYRLLEVEALAPRLPAKGRVVELGGGTGWQAALLERRGLDVVSIDLPSRHRRSVYFDVAEYDGVRMPIRSRSADVLWSSSVMEHVTNLHELATEMTRVAAPGAIAIHIVPTPWWRLWNSLAFPVAVVKRRVRSTMRHDGGRPTPTMTAAGGPTRRT